MGDLDKVAVLASGGLDSSVMLAELTKRFVAVHPIYVSCGLVWESEEKMYLREFISKLGNPRIKEVCVLTLPTTDIYGDQWFTTGEGIPVYHDPDEEWEIPGRNIILLAKAAVWAKLNSISQIGIGSLGSNPFSDATEKFFSSAEKMFSLGLNWPLKILRPFAQMSKADIISVGNYLPLESTLSCACPVKGKHCRACGKCRERVEGFAESGISDPTPYGSNL